MTAYKRKSPVVFPARPAETETRGGWDVVLTYETEGGGPWLVDLSHRQRWDIQNGGLDELKPWGRDIPQTPGGSMLQDGLLVNRMNRTQASAWNLRSEPLPVPEETAYTDMTDGQCLLAVMGPKTVQVMERICSLDLFAPGQTPPRLVQGPVLHIPCQIAVLKDGDDAAVLIAFSRGYGQAMSEAILDSAADLGLRPAGESAFTGSLAPMTE